MGPVAGTLNDATEAAAQDTALVAELKAIEGGLRADEVRAWCLI